MNRYVWVIVGVGAGCNGWPRFSHLPDEGFVEAEGSVRLFEVGNEARDGDRPDLPSPLVRPDGVTGEVYTGIRWRGGLGWEPAVGVGESRFQCPEVEPPIPLFYPSDVDFFRFEHRGGSLCVTTATALRGEAQPSRGSIGGEGFDCPDDIARPVWEAPLYAIADDGTCITGQWLNPSDGMLPRAIGVLSNGLFFPDVPPGDYAVFLAAVCGRYEGAETCPEEFADDSSAECVPYDLAIAVVPSQAACDGLHEQLRENL